MPRGIWKRTKKHRQERSIMLKTFWQNPEYRKHMSEIHKKSLANQKHCRELHKMNKGKHHSPNTEFKKGYIPWHKGKKLPHLSGDKASHWKDGKRIFSGYIYVYQSEHPFCSKQKYIAEHRLIIEKFIKRYLLPKEKSHHLNKIRTDNRPKNLMAFASNSAHARFHKNPFNVKPSEIIFDGRAF